MWTRQHLLTLKDHLRSHLTLLGEQICYAHLRKSSIMYELYLYAVCPYEAHSLRIWKNIHVAELSWEKWVLFILSRIFLFVILYFGRALVMFCWWGYRHGKLPGMISLFGLIWIMLFSSLKNINLLNDKRWFSMFSLTRYRSGKGQVEFVHHYQRGGRSIIHRDHQLPSWTP